MSAEFSAPREWLAASVAAALGLLTACAVRVPSMSAAYRMPSSDEIQARQTQELARFKQIQGKGEPETRHSLDGVQIVLQDGHTSGISAIAMSSDGRHIVSGDYTGVVKLWDVASGKEVRTLITETGALGLRFSADGHRVLVGSDTLCVVYDTATGRQLTREPLTTSDGRFGVSTDRARGGLSLIVLDLAAAQPLAALPTKGERPIAMSPDGAVLLTWAISRKFFSAPLDGEYVVWDVKVRQPIFRLPEAAVKGEPVLGREGHSLLAENSDGSIDSYDLPGGQKHRLAAPEVGKTAPTVSFTLSQDGQRLARVTHQGAIEVYDLANGAKLQTLAVGPSPQAWLAPGSLQFSPDAQMLASRSAGDGFLVWDLPSGRQVARLQATALNFVPGGHAVVLGRSNGGAPVMHDLAGGSESALTSGAAGVLDVAVTGDGHYAVAGSYVGGAKLWDLGTGQLLRSFECPGGMPATGVSVSRRAPLVATACMDGSAWLWDIDGARPGHPLNPPLAGAGGRSLLRFSDDGRMLAVAVNETVTLWDVSAIKRVREITLPRDALPPPMANPNASVAALDPELRKQLPRRARDALDASEQANAAVDPKMRQLMLDGAYRIDALAIHPNGRALAVGRPSQVSLWNLDTGERIRIFNGTNGPLAAAAAQASGDGADRAAEAPWSRAGSRGARAGSGASGLLGSLIGRGSANTAAKIVTVDDPGELSQWFDAMRLGARNLAFGADGRTLFADGLRWDVATGQLLMRPRPAGSTFDPAELMEAEMDATASVNGVSVSPDGRTVARGVGRVIRLSDAATGEDIGDLVGHTGDVQSLAFAPDGGVLVSGAMDGSLRIWKLSSRQELVDLFALGPTDFVAVTPDQYYRASKSRLQGVSFRVGNQLYPFEQFDLQFNRPDIVLERLGRLPQEAISSYRAAYEHRLTKSGFTQSMLSREFHVPEASIVGGEPPVSTDAATLTVRVHSKDEKYPLDRLSVFVNDVPVFGTAGMPIGEAAALVDERDVQVPLVPGRNKIQISVLNRQGAESLSRTLYTTSNAVFPPADVYVVAIGVSEYKNRAYNLRFAAKDAADVMSAYQSLESRAGEHGRVHLLDLTNSRATRAGIHAAREWLKQARTNDLAVVFAAGHGMTDAQQNYYFGTFDIDPAQPQINGLPYEEFEALLDGIPALKKVLLLDTCFSGEIDKDEPVAVAQTDAAAEGAVSMRAFKAARGITLVADTSPAASPGEPAGAAAPVGAALNPEVLRFQQDLFADLRRGTGAVVISSASGNEYALEGERWSNGVFTYALLSGLRDRKADVNNDGTISVSELQAYVIDEVRRLTAGGQNPTVRRENLDFDFNVY